MGSFAVIVNGSMEEDLNAAMRMLHTQGHAVRPYIRYGVLWFEIDGILATRQELQELADGVYSVTELRELVGRRRTEERGNP